MARFMSILTAAVTVSAHARTLYDLAAVDIDGHKVSMADFAGNVSVIMNVATL